MNPMTTRSRWTTICACLMTGALTGCDDSNIDGGSSSCTDAFGPPEPVSETLEDFRVGTDQDFPTDLSTPRTALYSFLQAVEPDSSEDDGEKHALAEQVRELTQPFIESEGELPDYDTTRNKFDLLESLISSDHFSGFKEARNAMQHCLRESEQGNFDVNNVALEEKPDEDDPDAEPETWGASVSWSTNPSSGDDEDDFVPLPNITRFVITDTADFILTLYDPDSFSATGFNEPLRLEAIFNHAGRVEVDAPIDEEEETGDEAGEAAEPSLLFASLRDLEYDEWQWSAGDEEPETVTLNDTEVDALCIEARLEYEDNSLEIRASEESCLERDRDEDEVLEYTTAAGKPQS